MQQNNQAVKNKNRAARRLAALCAGALGALLLCSVLPVCGEQNVYGEVVRLHVLAATDSAADQALKYEVRDFILQHCRQSLWKEAADAAKAVAALRQCCGEIEEAVNAYLARRGAGYGCTVDVKEQYFSRRWYGTMCFPAGEYEALVITLGTGQGKNWWCVLYPPLCLRAAGGTGGEKDEGIRVSAQNRRALEEAGVSKSAADMLSDGTRPRIRLKLRLVEIIEALFGGV